MESGKVITAKRAYTRLEFTTDQEERLIDFVKSDPPMYNPKDALYKNKSYRDRLWDDIGQKLEKSGMHYLEITLNKGREQNFHFSGSDCNKRWVNIRDTYNKNKNKKLGTGSSAEMKKRRCEMMSFSDEITTVNRA